VPRVYNGKDKTFFFVNYEGFRLRRKYHLTSSSDGGHEEG
jgi:hypothetical protein